MKTKFSGILTLLLAFVVQFTFAQEKTVSGTVSDNNSMPLPGATVVIKGTSTGASTDFDGNYSITANVGDVLNFSYVGYSGQSVPVGATTTMINVILQPDNALEEVVVTALGIKREKKSLGYATQEVKGDAVSKVKSTNFVNSLSGKIAGLDIKTSGTLGGSTNVVIRGNSSVAGNNQALFVIDGIPINNGNTNTRDQTTGRGGYDYGNAASVFTQSGGIAKQVMERASAGMIGVNIGVPVPREPFSFGGWNESKFGVGDITGRSSIEFWTQNKKTTTKWNPEAQVNWMS